MQSATQASDLTDYAPTHRITSANTVPPPATNTDVVVKKQVAPQRGRQVAATPASHLARPTGLHVFGAAGALTFELDQVRSPEEEGRGNTIRIEGAKSVRQASDNRFANEGDDPERSARYDWTNKTIVQLTLRELHQAAAVLIGCSTRFELHRKGDGKDKSVRLERQADAIFIRMREGRVVVAVPVAADSLYRVSALFFRPLTMNHPELSSETIYRLIESSSFHERPAPASRS